MAQMIEMNWSPDAKTLRNFGLIAVVGFGFVATIAHFEWLIFAMGLGAPLEDCAFCGEGNACCRSGWDSDPAECLGVTDLSATTTQSRTS